MLTPSFVNGDRLRARVGSAMDRLRYMAGLIHAHSGTAQFREIAGGFLSGRDFSGNWLIRPYDQFGELRAIYEFVQRNVRYTKDPFGMEGRDVTRAIFPPDKTMRDGIGDCDDQVVLAGTLAHTVGYPVKLRGISQSGTHFDHTYALAGVRTRKGYRWVPVDTVLGKGIGKASKDKGRVEILV